MRDGKHPFQHLEQLMNQMISTHPTFDFDHQTQFGFDKSSPTIDVDERDEEVVVTADVTGFGKEEIDVRLIDDETLRIKAEKNTGSDEDEEDLRVHRQRYESISQEVKLPTKVIEESAEAEANNGILKVTFEKAEPSESGKKIEIK